MSDTYIGRLSMPKETDDGQYLVDGTAEVLVPHIFIAKLEHFVVQRTSSVMNQMIVLKESANSFSISSPSSIQTKVKKIQK